MQKVLKLLLLAALTLCLLTGCYQQNTTITVRPMGGIKMEMTLIGTDAGVSEASGGMTFEELTETILPQIESFATDESMTYDTVREDIGGETYNGVTVKGNFPSVPEMYAAQFYYAFNYSMVTPVFDQNPEEYGHGINFTEDRKWYGSVYKANGNINLTQGEAADESTSAELGDSKVTVKFSFPFSSVTFSEGNKNFIKPTFVYTADASSAENMVVPVVFSVFVPNIALLLALIIILGLLVAVILLISKNAKYKEQLAFAGAASGEAAEEILSEDDINFFEGNEDFESDADSFETDDAVFEEEISGDIAEDAEDTVQEDAPENNEDEE